MTGDPGAGADLARGVDLAALEPIEAYVLRAILEYEGLRVNWFPVATMEQLLGLLRGAESHARHLVICCHGDERGIVVPELAPGADPAELLPDRLTPELVRRHASLQGRVVIATGCVSGAAKMAGSFLNAGCAAYIAPDGYPHSVLLFLHRFYHELGAGASVTAAADAAGRQDDDGRLFRLWLPPA
ncbi:MAG TPA: hypothetical protein VKF59_12245 [Candidatus Dormibacteraeota bacterium]|nr:hypothetical protein [Candidatus Dormibacteraeota bacterium]